METGPRLKVSSDRLVKPEIEPVTPGLQGKPFIHYTTAAPLSWIDGRDRWILLSGSIHYTLDASLYISMEY